MDSLPPIRFLPLFKPAIWGGNRLRPMLGFESVDEPIGEAWILSDQGSNQSVVAEGTLEGKTLRQLLEEMPQRILGEQATEGARFPCLLKFIDAQQHLSVQVHPTDDHASRLEPHLPAIGKTEAWLVLESGPTAKIYAGLREGVTAASIRSALPNNEVEDLLYSCNPDQFDCFFLKAGTVHAIGAGLLLFEIQQTSDITYRLYDWGRVDPKTGQSRELHIDKGLTCVDESMGPCFPIVLTEDGRNLVQKKSMVDCDYFSLSRWETSLPFVAGARGECRVLVGISGRVVIRHDYREYTISPGDVWLLPAETGPCECQPLEPSIILECGIPG
jgi:mannose-6-phosphate isomerase